MSDATLDPQEMEAIQAALRESTPARRRAAAQPEPTRLALISDDRVAEAARPVLIDLASRWIRYATRGLRSYLSGSWQLDVVGAEVIEGGSAKEDLRGAWVAGMCAGTEEILIAVHGGVIDLAAARRCGAAIPTTESTRAPSNLSLRLFQPTGTAILDSWTTAWREVFSSALVPSSDLSIVARLIESRTVVRVVMSFAGSVSGRIQIYARPEVLVPRPAELAAVKVDTLRIANALATVPVDVIVELGTLRIPLNRLRRLDRTVTHMLQGFVDSRVPVYCGGVLKAWAKPVVSRGVLAVQIEQVVHGQGTKS